MKKKFLAIMFLVSAFAFNANAQAYEQGTTYHSIGLGGATLLHLTDSYAGWDGNGTRRSWYAPLTGQVSYQLEFGVSKYVGVGLTTGIGGRGNGIYGYSEFNIPVGAIANFHFYQLIEDKTSKDIHGDKLDIYVGANIGSGIAFRNSTFDNDVVPLLFFGPQTGVRYYVTDRLAINGEVGYGKTFINAGITLRP